MDEKALKELGLGNELVLTSGQDFGVCSISITVKGYVGVSIEIPGEKNSKVTFRCSLGKDKRYYLIESLCISSTVSHSTGKPV